MGGGAMKVSREKLAAQAQLGRGAEKWFFRTLRETGGHMIVRHGVKGI